MPKKPKKEKKEKHSDPEIHKLIKKMLKKEKTRRHIASHFGFTSKIMRYVIRRWKLDENLIVPEMVGVR